MSPEEKFDKSIVDLVKAQGKMNEALITNIEELEARIEKLEAKQPTASEPEIDPDEGIDHLDSRHSHWDNFDAPEATNE